MSRHYLTKVEPNWLDKAITFISPSLGAERLRGRTALAVYGAYTGARTDRRPTASWFPSRGSADSDTLYDLQLLRTRSRDLVRNNPMALGAVNTVCQNAVGVGLSWQPTPDITVLGWTEEQASEWAGKVEHEFAMWADSKDCDVTRTGNFYQLQELALRSCLESGDVFALLPMRQVGLSPYKTAIQLIEADRVMSPYGHIDGMPMPATDSNGTPTGTGNQVWAGVEVDAYGAPVAYLVYHKHPGSPDFMAGYKDNTLFDRVLAFGPKTGRRNVLHLYDRRRPDQKRGVPYLAPVIETLKQLDRFTEAELMAAVVTAMFTVFVTTPEDTGSGIAPGPIAAASGTNAAGMPTIPGGVSLGPGMINQLGPGEDVKFAETLRPNSGFDPFVVSILRQVGVALELPFEVLIKHFTASYSAARASMLEAWKFYKNRRNLIGENFCQPAVEAWMDEAVAIGRVPAPGYFTDPLLRRAYLAGMWIGDAPGSIDPGKDAEASQKLVDGGFSSIKRETMVLTGQNFEDVHAQRAREHQMRVDAGLEPDVLGATATEMVQPGAEPAETDERTPTEEEQDQQDGMEEKDEPAPTPAKQPAKPSGKPSVKPGKRGKK